MGLPLVESQRFQWISFDVTSVLPHGWQEDATQVATRCATPRVLRPRSVTSREADRDASIPVLTVAGDTVHSELPWLWALYHDLFLTLANEVATVPVVCATRDRRKINLNVQTGRSMRYECHVDSNPIEGILYLTTHPPGDGGELVVANRPEASSVDEVDQDYTSVHPVSGHLIFFDARNHPHYVRSLRRGDIRVAATMNYYTHSVTEDMRPIDLDPHLFGDTDDERTADG
jgi:hypothetical protein